MELFDQRLPDRFWDKVQPEPNSGCWLWVGSLNNSGYGTFSTIAGTVGAHRHAFEAEHGPIGGHVPDHKCKNRACVNPYHMEEVTYSENSVRANAVGKGHSTKTHCPRGHPFTAENTYRRPQGNKDGRNHRQCRICRKEYGALYRTKVAR